MELQELLKYVSYLYTRWKLEWRPGFNCTCNRNCTILRLCTGVVQSQDWHAVSGFSAVLRLCKLLDCPEHIHILVPTPSHTAGMDLCRELAWTAAVSWLVHNQIITATCILQMSAWCPLNHCTWSVFTRPSLVLRC